jgi:hypothetical protein
MGAQCGKDGRGSAYDNVARTPQLGRRGFHSALVSARKDGDVWSFYDKGPQIGHGMSGGVWLATSKSTGEKMAAKTIVLSRMQEELLDDLRNEINLLRDVRFHY